MNAHSPIDRAAASPLPAATPSREDLANITAGVVAAYVRGNHVPASELPGLIRLVDDTFRRLAEPEPEILIVRPTEAEIAASIGQDALKSFEDGRSYKALKRHLTLRGLTPEAYRRKWGLPPDYPMVAASYSAARSDLARALGLGQVGRARPEMQS